jgi:hypothetical protein
MRITVRSIKPCDDHDFPKMEAVIDIWEGKEEYNNSAVIEVFINKRDAPLSELKDEAIQTAIDFLKSAISSRS